MSAKVINFQSRITLSDHTVGVLALRQQEARDKHVLSLVDAHVQAFAELVSKELNSLQVTIDSSDSL
jgi:hypothetical protein